MILAIRGWEFSTAELSQYPPFACRAGDGRAQALLADGGRLARAYLRTGQDCNTLAGVLGCSYQITRQALAWYGIWPAEPLALKLWPEKANGGPPRKLSEQLPDNSGQLNRPGPPEPQGLTLERLKEIVARAYLRNDRCPPDCPRREECLSLEACYWYNGRGERALG